MGIGKNLNNELGQWAVLAILLVVLMIIINKIKVSSDGAYICSLPHQWYNATGDLCCNGTTSTLTSCQGTANQTAINAVGTVSNNFVTGLAEPGNWVVIVVVGLVGFALIRFMQSRKK